MVYNTYIKIIFVILHYYKFLEEKKMNKKGFTLIELIVVVAIIAILAAVAVPTFLGARQDAADAVAYGDAVSLCNALNLYNAIADTALTTDLLVTAKISGVKVELGDYDIAFSETGAPAAALANIGYTDGIWIVDAGVKPS